MQSKNLPIGYWIKQADEMLTKGIDEIQKLFNLTRTDWQIINSIHKNIIVERLFLFDLMKPFADSEKVEAVLTRLQNEGLLKSEDDVTLTLTQQGQELYNACFEQQQVFRQKVMAGVSIADYDTTVSTLKKIIENISSIK